MQMTRATRTSRAVKEIVTPVHKLESSVYKAKNLLLDQYVW